MASGRRIVAFVGHLMTVPSMRFEFRRGSGIRFTLKSSGEADSAPLVFLVRTNIKFDLCRVSAMGSSGTILFPRDEPAKSDDFDVIRLE